MDGNGRWATSRGLSRSEGHKKGSDAIDRLMDAAKEAGLKYISVYAFSTENWKRPVTEIRAIFSLLDEFIDKKLEKIQKNNIRIFHSGSTKKLPSKSLKKVNEAIEVTRKNTGIYLNFCLNYGSKDEIVHSVNEILAERKREKKSLDKEIKAKDIEAHLYTKSFPPVDLLIRTGGEYRLSNFLLWQSAYSELYFTEILWPDFYRETLFQALDFYDKRVRNFGGLKGNE
ncbi:MAG: polyprenyl diphosphate synthase [Leptospiraceae bacterium]|nr:di-trans,poly-cis-decaprenylcistransferase [Leptospiraceae bacterium]MCK6380100.1 polyprenyl diphosphate synthase [Leptospiraceae bacterium]NUM40527.1 di-trans,poly-cis-decaprenylcistransferase [Leptospiraceae bacterium]